MKTFGIDISEFQKGISFKKLKQSGVKFIMIRGGYTGYSNGISKAVDSCFKSFYKKAKKYNIPVGCYFFSRANTYGKGRDEAKFLYKNCLKGRAFEYPIAIDVEDSIYQKSASKKELTSAIKGFCEYLEAKGYYVIIYANLDWFNNKMKLKDLKRYDKWVACWSKSNPKSPKHGMWQFGGATNLIRDSKIDGYTVDQDYAFKDYFGIIKKKGLNGFKIDSRNKKKQNNKKNKYTTGEYITLDYMNIRTGPGVNYRRKKVKELTLDGRKNSTSSRSNSFAVYRKGTCFTALKIVSKSDSVWAQTPSGYICIKLKNSIYAKKV